MANELHSIRTIQRAMLGRRLKQKAAAEGLLLIAAIMLALLLASSLQQALLHMLAVALIGVPLFLARRNRDLRQLVRADQWRADALDGRGISLAAWHSGEALPRNNSRR